MRSNRFLLVLVPLGALLTSAGSAIAQEDPRPEADGRALLERNCGRCHAIDATGESPLAQAPPLRDIYRKFPAQELEMQFSEGAVSHYQAMPQIDFTDEEIASIMDYLGGLR